MIIAVTSRKQESYKLACSKRRQIDGDHYSEVFPAPSATASPHFNPHRGDLSSRQRSGTIVDINQGATDHSSAKVALWSRGAAAMSSRVGPIVLVLTGLLGAPAQAQPLLPAWETNITLTQDDLDLIHRTVDTQIHGKPLGTSASWVNPNTGNAGTIKLLHKFRKGNLQY
jgi:hypothetical protein